MPLILNHPRCKSMLLLLLFELNLKNFENPANHSVIADRRRQFHHTLIIQNGMNRCKRFITYTDIHGFFVSEAKDGFLYIIKFTGKFPFR